MTRRNTTQNFESGSDVVFRISYPDGAWKRQLSITLMDRGHSPWHVFPILENISHNVSLCTCLVSSNTLFPSCGGLISRTSCPMTNKSPLLHSTIMKYCMRLEDTTVLDETVSLPNEEIIYTSYNTVSAPCATTCKGSWRFLSLPIEYLILFNRSWHKSYTAK